MCHDNLSCAQDPGSDLRKEIQYSLIPLTAFLIDAAQYSAAAFTLDVTWPSWMRPAIRVVKRLFVAFDVPVVNVSYHAWFHAWAVLIVLSALPIAVPTQQILVVLGDVGAQILFGTALVVMTVAMLPCIRLLLKSMACHHGAPYFLSGVACYRGWHLYYCCLSPAIFVVLLVLAVKWEWLTTSPIEMAKMDRVFKMSVKDTPFSLMMLVIKIAFVLPLSLLDTALSVSTKAASMLVVSMAALACVVWWRPWHYVSTTSALAVPLLIAVCNNLVTVVVLHVPPHVASPLVVAYLVLCAPCCWIAYECFEGVLVRDAIRRILKQASFSSLPASPFRAGGDKAHKRIFPAQDDGLDETPSKTALAEPVASLDLSKMFLGASKDAIMRYADVLRRIRIGELTLRYNEFSGLHMTTILAAVQGSSCDCLLVLDCGRNRNMFMKAINEAGALTDVAVSTRTTATFLSKLGYESTELTEDTQDAWKARKEQWRSKKYEETTGRVGLASHQSRNRTRATVFNALRPIDPCGGLDALIRCAKALRVLSLAKTYLPLVVLERLAEAILESPSLESLDLSECHMDSPHAAVIGPLLAGAAKLSNVVLRYNRLGERGSRLIAKHLPHATQLNSFDVAWNDIGVNGAQAIVDAITWQLHLAIDCNTIPRLHFVKIKHEIHQRLSFNGAPQPVADHALDQALNGRSICEALGGEKTVSKVIDRFYIYVVTDPVLSHYFRNISMGRMRHLQASYICSMLGSAKSYRGHDIVKGHSNLGITHDHFDQACAWFVRAIQDVCPDLPTPILATCARLINDLRPSIVTKDPCKEPSYVVADAAAHVDKAPLREKPAIIPPHAEGDREDSLSVESMSAPSLAGAISTEVIVTTTA